MLNGKPAAQRLIVLEFNELCPAFIEQFMSEGILPNFKRLRQRAQTYITQTNERILEPWIQWVTVHTGVPFEAHGVMDLDQADKVRHASFWDAVSDNLLLMSPMNVRFSRDDRSIFMPDPWAASEPPSADIAPFYRFIRAMVQTHMRSDGFNVRSGLAALRFLATHGLKAGTAAAVVRQLAQEKRSKGLAKWQRAVILDRLLWDVFAYYWQSSRRPKVGVFFSNATAHYQHKYWRHHAPELFNLKPPAEELAAYGGAIRFGYQAHDRLIGKALAMADNDTAIALCTALSQQPMRDYEERGGKAMFIPKDFAALFSALGLPSTVRAEQIMAEEARLYFTSTAEATKAYAVVQAATTSEGHALFKTRGFDGHSFIIGCGVFVSEVTPQTKFMSHGTAAAAFADHFIPMPTVTTGKHHPDGVFWLATPQQSPISASDAALPLIDVRGKLEEVLDLPVFKYQPAPSSESPPTLKAAIEVA